jgi:hypothetical protein
MPIMVESTHGGLNGDDVSPDSPTTAGDPADSSIVIVNTCGFLEAAKRESVSTAPVPYSSGPCSPAT